jgi:hypothetical protein
LLLTGLLKFEVCCAQLGLLGVIYMDLAPRPGKVPSSGILYPVRCGRELPGEEREAAAAAAVAAVTKELGCQLRHLRYWKQGFGRQILIYIKQWMFLW